MPEAYIVAATRTAGGRKGGRLSGWHPADLAGHVIDDLLGRSGADPDLIDDVVMGCVTHAGEQALNVGRGAVLSSRLPETTPATTVDRQCGSSQQALHFAAQAVMSGAMDVVIAAGVESMTRAPLGLSYNLPAREGFGTAKSVRMEKRYPGVVFSQFTAAELMAKKYQLTREELDQFAFESHCRASTAVREGRFKEEILPVEITNTDGRTEIHEVDEGIRFDASLDGIRKVKLLHEGGVITAATSSQICDGASGLMVVNATGLKRLGVEPMARIHQMTVVGCDPVVMMEGPITGTQRSLKAVGMTLGDIDLYEINEAFASVPLAWSKVLGADNARLNVHGGGISLGHPLGSSGTKLMATLVNALKQRGGRYGLQAICEGAGLANVTIVERL